jgi:hypothetical protein
MLDNSDYRDFSDFNGYSCIRSLLRTMKSLDESLASERGGNVNLRRELFR